MINKAFLILTLSFFLTACAGTMAGGEDMPGAVYVMGKLETDVHALPIPLAQATKKAFSVLSVNPGEFHQTDLDAKVTGYTANDDKITVVVKRKTETVSHLSIRVGFFGDETLSQLIYEEIMRQLKEQGHAQVITAPVMDATPPPAVTPTPVAQSTPPTTVVTPTVTPTNG
jgi:predicted small secreted protein